MDRGRKRGMSPSAATLAKKQKLDADDKRTIQKATARIQARDRSQTRRDDLYKSNAVNSPLLRLPAEIRNMIFGYIFDGAMYGFHQSSWRQDRVVRMRVKFRSEGHHALDDLKLLLVSRQVHADTALLPYSLGSFDIWADSMRYEELLVVLDKFMKRRTEKQIDAMDSLKFDEYDVCDKAQAFPRIVNGTGAFWVAKLAKGSSQVALASFSGASVDSRV